MTEMRMDDANHVPAPPLAPRAGAWRRALPPFLLLLGAILLLFFDSFRAMEEIWARSESFAHAYVVPPISLWLIWRQRAVLAQQVPSTSPWMLLPFGAVVLMWLAGQMVTANAVTQLAATALLVLAVPLMLGWNVAKLILFPLAFLFFAVPIGEFMVAPLMQATADVTIAALRLSGIPVYREGLQFVIPSGNWSVVEACSGVRYLMASLMVGSLFAYLNYRSWRRRVVFGLVSLAVPIVANWMRAYMIVMLGHLSGNKLAVGADHLIYGWVFFGVVITIVFMIGARWAEAPAEHAAAPLRALATAPVPLGVLPWLLLGAAVALAAAPQGMLRRQQADVATAGPRLALPAQGTPGWRLDPAPADAWKPAYKNPDAELNVRAEAADGGVVDVYIAYYQRQQAGRKAVSSENVIVSSQDKDWNAVSSRQLDVPLADGPLSVRETSLLQMGYGQTDRPRRAVWQFYWVDGAHTSSDAHAKLLGAWKRLTGQGEVSAVVIVSAADTPDQPAARRLESFLRANVGMLDRQLAAVRAGR